jgi:DNA helicase-2/ATP-dependent DNA helicase PcrA
MEEEPAEELDSARLSGENAVTLVTVHRAKGLEWENVALPAVVKDNFPAGSGPFPDPVRFPYQLPVELRLDTTVADLPDEDVARRAYLRDRHTAQEWRVAYVAATRAKRRLLVSGAFWYGLPEPRMTPAEPSDLFTLVAAHPVSSGAGHAELGARPDILRAPDEGPDPDPLFDHGWQAALRTARDDPDELDRLAAERGVEPEYRRVVSEWGEQLFSLDDVAAADPRDAVASVSVTGLVTYAQCPKRYYWSDVDPLPRRRNDAATRGNEIHRRIELHQRGQIPFDELTPDLYDAVGEAGHGPGAFQAYEGSRFASARADLVEAPFTVELDNGYRVRGRIDAVYTDGGHWEVVDFKSGRRSEDPSRIVQLQAYAVAATALDLGIGHPESIDVSFAYLGDGLDVVTTTADPAWIGSAKDRLIALTNDIAAGEFTESPGEWCRSCDFLQFCEPGQRALSS